MNQDLTRLRDMMDSHFADLIPWIDQEIELLSLIQSNKHRKKRLDQIFTGVFNTIYFEPMIAYAYKVYYTVNRRAVLFARLSSREYMFKFKTKRIEVFLNGRSFGIINDRGELKSVWRGKLIGRIEQRKDLENLPLWLGKKEAASIINPLVEKSQQLRAIQIFGQMSPDDYNAILALVIPELVLRTNQIK